ncbi:type IV secretory system conjugative DNA transfer family protein [Halomarina pelagica]|uniref:type IV secretory system conjugative DNA transfer family protein n=1 Tax=Halomarina pelagica TaxID=2961599 RepID=UPI0020C41F80|nr:type IV secretion system DNA-binding domain-containing protein [Halomarina sp. BND7]
MNVLSTVIASVTLLVLVGAAIEFFFRIRVLAWPRRWLHTAEQSIGKLHRFAIYPIVLVVSTLLFLGGGLLGEFVVGLTGLTLPFIASGVAVKRRVRRKLTERAARKADEMGYRLPMDVIRQKNIGSTYGGILGISDEGSILCLGATRSGKTEVGKHLLAQLQTQPDEPIVVFDYKTDYQQCLNEWGAEIIRLSGSDSTHRWNLFREAETERDFDELGRALFPTDTGSSRGSTEFFSTAARQLFVATLKYLDREAADAGKVPSNAMLVRYFQRTDAKQLYEDLTSYEDLIGAASAIDPDASKQAAGVYATVQQRVTDVFIDDFAKNGEFSIREYMEDPRGRVLVLDFPQRYGQVVTPVFRFFLDRAAMHALASPQRGGYFILDEVARIPGLRRIGDLVNTGAGQRTQVILTLQSVSQLYDSYGKDRGTAILSGLVTSVILRLSDPESIRYARAIIGTEFEEYTQHVEKRPSALGEHQVETRRETREQEEHPFAKGEFTTFDPGVGVVVRPDGWAHGYIPMLR